jgi:hypothetical protein
LHNEECGKAMKTGAIVTGKITPMRILLKLARFLVQLPLSIIDNIFANKKSQIIHIEGLKNLSGGEPVLIYVHYSKMSALTDREISTLTAIKDAGVRTLLVLNSDLIDLKSFPSNYADALIVRRNRGYDLGAYRDAFFALKRENMVGESSITFMNNSVIWFPDMLKDYLNNLFDEAGDIVGASISNQYVMHLQTFLFSAKSQQGLKEIDLWLSSIKNWRKKRTIVRLGELSTHRFFQSGIKTSSVPNPTNLVEMGLSKLQDSFLEPDSSTPSEVLDRLKRNQRYLLAGIPLNPSHDFWLELLEGGFPGIKIDLVRSNPSDILDYELIISKLNSKGFGINDVASLLLSNRSRSYIYGIRTRLRW